MVPVRRGGQGLAEEFEHRFRPISAGVAVPVFAFFSAGVAVGGWSGLGSMISDPIAIGVMAGLILGKPIGILAATWLTVRFTGAELDPSVRWGDLTGVAALTGIGFTVSLLVAELSFPGDETALDHGKAAVLVASLVVAVVAGSILSLLGRRREAASDRPRKAN